MTVLRPQVDCVVDAKATVAECPVWSDAEQALYWADIYRCALNRYDPSSGKNTFSQLPGPLGSFAPRRNGGILVALNTGLHFFDTRTNAIEPLVDPEMAVPDSRLNDGKCDRAGAFWVGSMKDPIEPFRATSAFYRFAPDRTLKTMIPGTIVSNGLGFSPDNKKIYWADTHGTVRSVFVADHDPADGAIASKKLFIDTKTQSGRPDGATVDAAGCYWMAAIDSGSLQRYTPAGKLDLTVELPPDIKWPTMPAFGGRNHDTLYFTTLRRHALPPEGQGQSGGVFVTRVPGVQGLPEPMFAG